jgi:plasmid stabilization system protein ParE
VIVRFLEVAQLELDEAISYYNQQAPGLGDAFLIQAVAAIERIQRFPKAWHPMGEQLRRCRLSRFPYALIYACSTDEILIVAVGHLHREPEYWRDRLGS